MLIGTSGLPTNSAFNSGLEGIRKGQQGLDKAAQAIARPTSVTEPGGLAESIVDLKVNANLVKANAAVIARVDETVGTLIDTFA